VVPRRDDSEPVPDAVPIPDADADADARAYTDDHALADAGLGRELRSRRACGGLVREA